MGNDTRPSRRAKDAENSNSKGKQSRDKGHSVSSSAAASDTPGLRRSSRETSAKRAAVAPSSPSVYVRKSERLENKSPKSPPPTLRKSERVEKKCSPSPLRKSNKGIAAVLASPASKKSDQNLSASSMKRKKSKKEKSVKELTMETEEVDRSETRSSKLKNKGLTGRSYRRLFKKHGKKAKASGLDHRQKKEKEDKFSEGDSNNCRDECDAGPVKLVDDDGTRENVDDEPEIIPERLSEVEEVEGSELVDSESGQTITKDHRSVKSGQDVIPSKKKRISLDGECDGLVTSARKKAHTSVADATLTKDRGEHEVSTTTEFAEKSDNHLQQKQSPRDLQIGAEQYTCFTCKLGGTLLCCDGRGCKRSYHLSCLDPPMNDVPLGAWYCLRCVKKKLESGVHSLSEGAESIWDAREVEVLDIDGLRKEREFFVKYKGLAHIHNLWVPESKLLLDAPSLVAKFNRKGQVTKWKAEWTLPRHLLQKRLLMSPKQRDQYLNEHAGEKLDTHYEWLVKWRGLDYEHVTWEFDNASLFSSPDGQALIKYYENHRNRVNGDSSSSKADKILESKNRLSVKSPQVVSGVSSPLDNNFSDYINKLHDFWRSGQNAVVIDEQERIVKAISLIQSFQPNACRPFLIISTSAALRLWDDEFSRLAPQVNVVVYSGNTDLRKSIRKVEFYGEGGCLILQVLITILEIVMEDLDVLKSIEWELLIIDESQRTRISSHCAQIKLLATERRLLLVSSQLKESTSEYLNLLSLLESHSESPTGGSLVNSSSDHIGKLKEKLSKYVVDRCKSDSSRFKEYWVPVQLSNVQLEYYCNALILNSALLCSPQKQDLTGVVQDLLKSTRKCCDHPYLVDRDIPVRLYKDLQPVEHLGVDIKASGKLRLLDMMLSEIKERGLRVIILFQDFERNSIGNILDDFLRLKFGEDSYECIVSGIQQPKKQAVLDRFNNKESGRFVCSIETRACLSSIKLSSVDAVIIYGSDWNPASDLRALQRITLDSQAEQIPIFRLYTSYTLEEKVLILAKQEKNIDCNLQNIGWSSSHLLLMWGASHQFGTLEKFHDASFMPSHADILSKDPSLENVTQDMLQIISSNGKETKLRSSSIILNVQQIGGAYRTRSLLPGELKSEADEGQPSVFWTKLLEGKHPQWKYIQESSHRNRKKVQHFEVEGASDEGVRKRRKFAPSLELGSVAKTISRYKQGARGSHADLPNSLSMSPACISEITRANCTSASRNYNFESEVQRKLRDAQGSLHLSLKPNILKLRRILKFSDDAEGLLEEFLEYVMNNHHVSRETATILEAFQISLCWTVASMLKQKIDHKESVALAQQHLNFNCSKDEVDSVYSILRCLKGTFLCQTGKHKVADSPSANEQRLLSPMGMEVDIKLAHGVCKSISEIRKKFRKKLNKLIQRQQEEKIRIVRSFEEDKVRIEERKRIEIAVIRSCFPGNSSMRVDKLKSVDISFAKEFEELENQKDTYLKKLEPDLLAARSIIRDKEARRISAVKSWAALDELLRKRPSCEPGNFAGEVALRSPQTSISNDGVNNIAPLNVDTPSSEEQICNGSSMNMSEKDVQLGVPETIDSSDGLENIVSGDGPLLEEQPPDTTAVSISREVQLGVPGTICSSGGLHNLVSGSGPLLEEQIPDTAAVSAPINEMQLRVPENVSSSYSDTIVSVTQMPLAEQFPDTTTLTVPGGRDGLLVAVSSSDEVEVRQASEENDETRIATSNDITCMNQQDRVNGAVDENSSHQELSQVIASDVQPSIAVTHGEQNAIKEAEHLGSQPIETEPSNQSDHGARVSEPAVQVHLPPSSNSPSRYNAVDVPLVEEVANLPSSEGCILNPATELSSNSPPMLNQAVSRPSTSSLNQAVEMPIGVPGMHFPDMRTSIACEFNSHPAQTVPTVPLVPPPLYPDSLQKELERLCKEFDQICKGFEEKKLHLQSECDKEIAQIRLKYQIQQQEADAEYFTKRKEFDDKQNKVWMNKILAEAFRFKCLELRSSGRLGMRQDLNVTLMQKLIQISLQQNALRPCPVASTSLTNSPAAGLQTLVPEPNLQPTIPAAINGPRTTPPPPVHCVSPPSALFPSAIAPQIGSFSGNNGNQGSAQIRARPPHLRSSTSRGLPTLPNGVPAPELLRNVDHPPTASGSLVDGVPNICQLNSSQCGTSSVPANPVGSSALTDVVYLSDDD